MMKLQIFLLLILTLFVQTLPVFSQTSNPEIFLFSIEKKDGKFTFTDGKNITNNPGYDNQPSFSLNGSSLLFTSNRNGKDTNIYEYFLADGKTNQITSSEDNEYTAKEFDGNTINFVREGRGQEMTVWKYDRQTKHESPALKNKESVAYYAFNSKGDALVWIRYAYFIHWVNPEKGINKFVTDYAQPSTPQRLPATDNFSFMKRLPNDELWIYEFNPTNQAIRPVVQTKDAKITYCWMDDGSLLIGSGPKLFRFDEKSDKNWVLIADLSSFGIKDIGRISNSFDGKFLALVSNQ
jgi:dipeptidyl aminopeptidase/acylaminoacyl peptidase